MIDRYDNIANTLFDVRKGIADSIFLEENSYVPGERSNENMRLSSKIAAIGHAALELRRINGILKEYPVIL